MYLKAEHILIVLLLLPFGLRGVMTTPVIDILLILAVVGLVPAFLIFIYEKSKPTRIGKLAVKNLMLSQEEVAQILFCQKHSDEKFGEIALRRNFLTSSNLDALLVMQKI